MTGEVKVLRQDDGVTVDAPASITGEKWFHDDESTWNDSLATVTYTIDGSGVGTGAVSDPRKAHWVCYDLDNDIEYGGEFSFPSSTQIKCDWSTPVPTGTSLRFVGTM